MVHPQGVNDDDHLDVVGEKLLLDVSKAPDRLGRHGTLDAGFLKRFLSCGLRERLAGHWPTLRNTPSPRAAAGDEKHFNALVRTEPPRKRTGLDRQFLNRFPSHRHTIAAGRQRATELFEQFELIYERHFGRHLPAFGGAVQRVTREIELKLECDRQALPLIHQHPLLAHAELRKQSQLTIYYDTPATVLKKHGLTLRVRSSENRFIQTLKSAPDGVGLVSRDEFECDVRSIEPEIDALNLPALDRLRHGGQLAKFNPIMSSQVERTTWHLDRRNGKIQVDLDEGTISAGEHAQDFCELEFELIEGVPASLLMVARSIADEVPVRIGVLTKSERGALVSRGKIDRVHKAGPVHVCPEMTVGEAFATIVSACLKHYRLNEPLVIGGRHGAALHQARVAVRQLRSAISLFKPAVADVEYQHLRQEIRWFSTELGDARNLDVFLGRETGQRDRAELVLRRERAYDQVVDAMNSSKLARLEIDLVGWAALGAWRAGKLAKTPISAFATSRLDLLWKSIALAGPRIEQMDETTRHDLRIEVKKMRYAVEFLRQLYPQARGARKAFTSAIGALQESLGKLNDLAVAKTLGSSPAEDGWLIGSFDERRHLGASEDALRELVRIGPFWRGRKS